MKGKIIRYLIMIVIIILIFFSLSIGDALVKIYQNYSMNHRVSSFPYNICILQFIINCFAGMIFGIEKVLSENKRNGKWRIDLPKFIIFGVPSFILGISIILMWKFTFLPYFLGLYYINFSLFVNFMQMLFGYTITTCFYKTVEI
jgi:hypothetical protein